MKYFLVDYFMFSDKIFELKLILKSSEYITNKNKTVNLKPVLVFKSIVIAPVSLWILVFDI